MMTSKITHKKEGNMDGKTNPENTDDVINIEEKQIDNNTESRINDASYENGKEKKNEPFKHAFDSDREKTKIKNIYQSEKHEDTKLNEKQGDNVDDRSTENTATVLSKGNEERKPEEKQDDNKGNKGSKSKDSQDKMIDEDNKGTVNTVTSRGSKGSKSKDSQDKMIDGNKKGTANTVTSRGSKGSKSKDRQDKMIDGENKGTVNTVTSRGSKGSKSKDSQAKMIDEDNKGIANTVTSRGNKGSKSKDNQDENIDGDNKETVNTITSRGNKGTKPQDNQEETIDEDNQGTVNTVTSSRNNNIKCMENKETKPKDNQDEKIDGMGGDSDELYKNTSRCSCEGKTETVIQLSMAQVTLTVIGMFTAYLTTQTMFFYMIKKQVQDQSTSARNISWMINDSVWIEHDVRELMDQFQSLTSEIVKSKTDIVKTASNNSKQTINTLTNLLKIQNETIQNISNSISLMDVHLKGMNESQINLTIQNSVLYQNLSQIISSISLLNDKWDDTNSIVLGLNRSINEDIVQRNRSEKQRKYHMDRQSKQQQEILITSLDFRYYAVLLFGVLEITVVIGVCAWRSNRVIPQQKHNAQMKCVDCDGIICFLEISLSKEAVQKKDNCIYKELSKSVMEAMNVDYCHKLIEHRENINNILKHDVYVLFLHLTHRGSVLEKSFDLSDYRRTLVKCLMERSNNVLIVVTQHDASNNLEEGLVSTDLKCVKGDATLEELKENGCLLSIKDKFTAQQIQHIRSVLPLKCRGKK